MCGDSHLPAAPSSGDLVAVIHGVSHPTSSARLRLSNHQEGVTTTILQFGKDDRPHFSRPEGAFLSVRIHKYGQPVLSRSSSAIDSDSEDEIDALNPVLHSFIINPAGSSRTTTRLDLGVGGDGVVGRTVSIVDGGTRKVLGEGIIGWN